MEAARLREEDRDYRNHLQAYLNFAAQATDKKGKPIYKTFGKFYDRKANREGKPSGRFARLIEHKRKEGEQ